MFEVPKQDSGKQFPLQNSTQCLLFSDVHTVPYHGDEIPSSQTPLRSVSYLRHKDARELRTEKVDSMVHTYYY